MQTERDDLNADLVTTAEALIEAYRDDSRRGAVVLDTDLAALAGAPVSRTVSKAGGGW